MIFLDQQTEIKRKWQTMRHFALHKNNMDATDGAASVKQSRQAVETTACSGFLDGPLEWVFGLRGYKMYAAS